MFEGRDRNSRRAGDVIFMRASIPSRREDVTQNVQPLTWHPTETAVPELTSTRMCARTSHEVSHAASGNRFPRSRKPFTKRPSIREGRMRAINILNMHGSSTKEYSIPPPKTHVITNTKVLRILPFVY